MPVTLEAFGIDRLSVDDRLELIELIWDSLPDQTEPLELTPELIELIAQRRADAAANPGVGRPYQEVLGNRGMRP